MSFPEKPRPGPRITARLLAALAVILLGWCAPGPARALDKVSLQLLWVHQAQFAGVYLAQDQGIYARHGLEVEVLPGGPGITPLQRLQEQKVDFALAWLADAMVSRENGFEVVNLAQVVQRSSLLLVAREDQGIATPADLDGKRVGLWGAHFSVAPQALFRREGISIREVRQGNGMALFLDRAVVAASAMRYNELHQLFQSGLDYDQIKVFDFAALGLDFPEDGIYALGRTWRERPELCRRLARATLEGWRAALDQPQAALAAVMRRVDSARLASNRPHQAWMLRTIAQTIAPSGGGGPVGRLDPADVTRVGSALVAQGLLVSPVDPADIITNASEPRP